MSIRVVAGTHGGRRLQVPEGDATRPTPDRVREAVFNSLFSLDALRDAVVVDLYAGSGALGIEALSRGAASVVFVESNRRSVETLRANLELLGESGAATVVATSVDLALAGLPRAIDLVLADPPYDFDGWAPLLEALAPRLAEDAIVVIESNRVVEVPAGWEKVRERTYGGTVVVFARRGESLD